MKTPKEIVDSVLYDPPRSLHQCEQLEAAIKAYGDARAAEAHERFKATLEAIERCVVTEVANFKSVSTKH